NRPAAGAEAIIRQRRSAVAFDGKTSITAEQFYWMMDRMMPRFDVPPWSALGRPVCVHLGLFVHLVEGISPGLYCLVRAPEKESELRAAMAAEFLWGRPPGCPEGLPLFLLQRGDARRVAAQVSCGQEIAGESAFSLGMIAEFERPLREYGAWFYRRLFWECGMIGQVLYLESEAAGVRGTGIGCFFDDAVHEVFGLHGRAYQSLYHFTVGGPVEDTRLTTRAAYPTQMVAMRNGTLNDGTQQ
ncbi:MAG: SagB/ThcOx family dehydrogenase, partial [Phycisphaerales bacterium]|nr:SagB/ThcOx family dehydrogenase [Phycisphaerales bacterium]